MLLLDKTFGSRYRQTGARTRALNPAVWARLLAKQMKLVYHVHERVFSAAALLEKMHASGLLSCEERQPPGCGHRTKIYREEPAAAQ